MNTMTTYSGRKFDPMQMTPGDVYIEDIAHALSLLCRGGGQLTYFIRWDSIRSTVLRKRKPEGGRRGSSSPVCFMMPVRDIFLILFAR